jgi:hypothetical protein
MKILKISNKSVMLKDLPAFLQTDTEHLIAIVGLWNYPLKYQLILPTKDTCVCPTMCASSHMYSENFPITIVFKAVRRVKTLDPLFTF